MSIQAALYPGRGGGSIARNREIKSEGVLVAFEDQIFSKVRVASSVEIIIPDPYPRDDSSLIFRIFHKCGRGESDESVVRAEAYVPIGEPGSAVAHLGVQQSFHFRPDPDCAGGRIELDDTLVAGEPQQTVVVLYATEINVSRQGWKSAFIIDRETVAVFVVNRKAVAEPYGPDSAP